MANLPPGVWFVDMDKEIAVVGTGTGTGMVFTIEGIIQFRQATEKAFLTLQTAIAKNCIEQKELKQNE